MRWTEQMDREMRETDRMTDKIDRQLARQDLAAVPMTRACAVPRRRTARARHRHTTAATGSSADGDPDGDPDPAPASPPAPALAAPLLVPLLTPLDLARYLGLAKQTVYIALSLGRGIGRIIPPPNRIGVLPRWRVEDVEAWVASRLQPLPTPTPAPAPEATPPRKRGRPPHPTIRATAPRRGRGRKGAK